jgi:hypothetical protein
MAYGNISVLTTATLIVAGNCARKGLSIVNHGTQDVFIGIDTAITVSNALPLYQYSTRDQMKISEGYFGPVYGITASGTSDVRYWEVI